MAAAVHAMQRWRFVRNRLPGLLPARRPPSSGAGAFVGSFANQVTLFESAQARHERESA